TAGEITKSSLSDPHLADSCRKAVMESPKDTSLRNIAGFIEFAHGRDRAGIEHLSIVENSSDAGELLALAYGYFQGDVIPKDISKAIELYERSAALGLSSAMLDLGTIYANGDGVERDIQKANSLWEQAANVGNSLAAFNLGISYANGQGVEKSPSR